MTEPASSSAAAATGLVASGLIALLGPNGVEYTAIACAAVSGALWPLSKRATDTRGQAVWLVLRLSLTSMCLTGLIVWAMQARFGWSGPGQATSIVVAFLVAAIGDDWQAVITGIGARVKGLFERQGPRT